jgi:hypothetical protein
MRVFLIGVAALAAMASVAEARDGCGQGWFFNGVRCVPFRAGPPVVVAPPPPVYAPRPAPGPRGWAFAGPDKWGKPTYFPGPRGNCPPGGFTLQDGLCKPYRGF